MKLLNFLICLLLVILTGISSIAQTQNNELVTTILPVGGKVKKGGQFRVDVAFTYSTSQYTDYKIKVKFPAGVTWSKLFTTDAASVKIDASAITGPSSENEYEIPLLPMVAGTKSTNFYLEGLLNNTPDDCSKDLSYDIKFALLAKQNVLPIKEYTSILITAQRTEDGAYLELELSQNQESNTSTSSVSNFPYYVDVKIKGGGLSQLPTVNLFYPDEKLTFVNAVLFNNSYTEPPFHTQILDATSIVTSTGVINIKIENNPLTYNSGSGEYIRFYFKPRKTDQLLTNEVKLEAEGAKYVKCGTTEPVDLGKKTATLTNFPVLISASSVYPSFQYKNNPIRFCAQNCNFNIASFDTKFKFEINDIYTQFTGPAPRVRVECPISVAKIKSLTFDASQYAVAPKFKYLVDDNTNEKDANVSGNTVTFGADNPKVIIIYNYVPDNAAFVAKDFTITYSARVLNLETVPLTSKVFNLNYESNFANSKTYTSEPVLISDGCESGMSFTDAYEYKANGQNYFGTNVTYLPGDHKNIRITINPRNIYYKGVYKISGVNYQLNSNMILDPDNQAILYSETGIEGSYKRLTPGKNGTYYKNINVTLDRSTNSLIIHNIDLNNTNNCGVDKIMYIIIGVVVKPNANFSPDLHQSLLSDNGSSFESKPLSKWNVVESPRDILSADVKVICPKDGQEVNEFGKEQSLTIQYIISNETQNSVKSLVYKIPALTNAEIETSDPKWIKIRTKNSISGNLNSKFTIDNVANALTVTSIDGYEFYGNDKIYMEVRYKVKGNVAIGASESGITFKLESYKSINGSDRAEAKPDLKDIKSFKIVKDPICIPTPPCKECVTSFSPVPGREYLLSGWVKESYEGANLPTPKTYKNSGIQISFNDGDLGDFDVFWPTGPIIDGWQRIEKSFVVPDNAYNIFIELVNEGDNEVFFDDIRIHPFSSNMKSFVYDPTTQKLVAELDENNYATYYEYDDEGILIRVKKETQRGVMTIKESRNNQSKIK